MGRIQQFLTGFYKMTFQGKGAFWGVLGAILIIVLVYFFAERIRERLKGKTGLLLIIPAVILIGAVWLFISACQYTPIAERSAENPVTYAWEQTTSIKKSKLEYTADKKDDKGYTYIQKYDFEDIVAQFTTEEKSEHVFSEYTITNSDKNATIVFSPDGTYKLQATDSQIEETGTYTFTDESSVLELTSSSGQVFTVKTKTQKLNYTTDSGEKFSFATAEVRGIKDKCTVTETTERVFQEYTVTSEDGYYTDESTTLTFSPDGTYRFRAQDSQKEESGQYIYRNSALTMANASGSDAFWKNAAQGPLGWLIFAIVFSAALVLVFMYSAQIKAFMKKHPLIWLVIPAALLIYFVYVAIGWNIWVSVSDWPEGEVTPSYSWNSDAWKSKASLKGIKQADREKEKDLILLYKADGLEIDTYEFGIGYTIIEEETEEIVTDQGTETIVKKKEVMRKDYFYIPVSSFDTAAGGDAVTVFYSDNIRAKITINTDGTYHFETVLGDYEEEGAYTYQDGNLTFVRPLAEADSDDDSAPEAEAAATAEKEPETIQAKIAKAPYSTSFAIPDSVFSCPLNSSEGKVLEAVSYNSDDEERAKITFSPDRTFTFEVAEDDYREMGEYTFEVQKDEYKVSKLLTVANATGVKAVWKSFASGFTQYAKMFSGITGEEFWNAVWNTLKLFLIIPICLLLGMGLALIMDQGLKGTPVFRTLILLPFALSFVVTGLIWQQMYNGSGGILVEFLKLLGINSTVNWTSNEMVMFSIMIVMIWQFSGYVAVIFLAAIKNVPTNIINAAKLDGAYMPRIYWKMIIPQLKGATGSCITILAMYALRSFDLIYSLTSYTNPASTTLPIMMYVEAFSKNNYAYAAAISCFLLALVLVLILPLTYWTNRGKK